ncbi:hypothetical protein F4779DRAFT_585491 [Xylariaceae sp. FL0662B]|nr:hypothetical protein F4779DRAFT_585491 [Xylariaceae sp. FL0662B]
MNYYATSFRVIEKKKNLVKRVIRVVTDILSLNRAIKRLYNDGLIEPDAPITELGVETQVYSTHGYIHSWTQHILNKNQYGKCIQTDQVTTEYVGRHVPWEDIREY